jgi:hypothetical protein
LKSWSGADGLVMLVLVPHVTLALSRTMIAPPALMLICVLMMTTITVCWMIKEPEPVMDTPDEKVKLPMLSTSEAPLEVCTVATAPLLPHPHT